MCTIMDDSDSVIDLTISSGHSSMESDDDSVLLLSDSQSAIASSSCKTRFEAHTSSLRGGERIEGRLLSMLVLSVVLKQ